MFVISCLFTTSWEIKSNLYAIFSYLLFPGNAAPIFEFWELMSMHLNVVKVEKHWSRPGVSNLRPAGTVGCLDLANGVPWKHCSASASESNALLYWQRVAAAITTKNGVQEPFLLGRDPPQVPLTSSWPHPLPEVIHDPDMTLNKIKFYIPDLDYNLCVDDWPLSL